MIANVYEKHLLRHIGHPLLYQNPPIAKYNIWLPSTFPQDHADETALGRTTLNDYKEFDHLTHATHIKVAIDVVEDQKLRGMPVEGWSEIQEMLPYKNFTWSAPNTALENPCRYGPAVLHFCMKGYEDILRWTIGGDWCHYWIEVIDYQRSAASRILVLPKGFENDGDIAEETRARLRQVRFDPRKRGGPWYWDEQNGKHYYLPKSSAYLSGYPQTHVVEFVRLNDFSFSNNALGISFVNHGLPNVPMNGYLCKQFFGKCKENMTASRARVRFYFTMACRSYKDFSCFIQSNREEKEHLRIDFVQLLNELKPMSSQMNVIYDNYADNECTDACWFGLSRAMAEDRKRMATFFARHLTREQLWNLIRQKLFLTGVLSIDTPS